MPVTILLEGHRPEPEQILAHFFVNDNFRLMDPRRADGIRRRAPEGRGGALRPSPTSRQGRRRQDKRITARHVARAGTVGTTHISVPGTSWSVCVVARNIVDPDTGEIVGKANDELTEALKKLRDAGIAGAAGDLHQRTGTRAPTSADPGMDETADELAARGHLPHDAPRRARPPDAVQACSSACSTTPRTPTTCPSRSHEIQRRVGAT